MHPDAPLPRWPLLMLATGTFAIGTEGFMIAPLLPAMAGSLHRTPVEMGLLVTGFTLAYGLGSPVLTAASARLERRRLLLASMAVFLLGNLICTLADSFAVLLLARLLMGAAAGLYMPNAVAVASSLASPARRGRALALVAGGQSLAIALGVPLMVLLGARAGWRASFAGVAALSVLALLSLGHRLAPQPPARTAPGWAERLAPLRRGPVVLALAVTVLWAAGAYTMLTYLAVYLEATLGVHGAAVGAFMATWGVAAAAGVFLGGAANDRLGAPRVLRTALAGLGLAFLGLALLGAGMGIAPTLRLPAVLLSLAAWGLTVWGFFPAQQARLIALVAGEAAPLVLSLNASAMYLGFAAGSALGGAVLSRGSTAGVALAAALCEALALAVALRAGAGPRTQSWKS
jgi:predicted MFS family arabinose efflux permease